MSERITDVPCTVTPALVVVITHPTEDNVEEFVREARSEDGVERDADGIGRVEEIKADPKWRNSRRFIVYVASTSNLERARRRFVTLGYVVFG